MNTLRETTIYPVKIKLEARDQYNDYSVIFDHIITVTYASGRHASFELGTDAAFAIAKYDAAVALVWRHAAREHNAREVA